MAAATKTTPCDLEDAIAANLVNEEELAEAAANLGGRIINLPLMAGFDLDAPPGEPTPTEMLGKLTLKTWTEDKLDWAHIEKCREVGVKRFKKVDRNRLKKKAISDRALAAIDLWQVDYLATLSGAPAKFA